jgi:hypothetical protein
MDFPYFARKGPQGNLEITGAMKIVPYNGRVLSGQDRSVGRFEPVNQFR